MKKAISLWNKIPPAIVCFLGGLLLSLNCYAQSATQLSDKISLTRSRYTVYELCNAIQKQVDVSVSYNASTIKSNKKIIVSNKPKDLKSLLMILKKDYGIDSKMAGNHIILIPGKDYGKTPKGNKKTRKVSKKKPAPVQEKQLPETLRRETRQQPEEDAAAEAMPLMVTAFDSMSSADLSAGSAGMAGGSTDNVNYETEHKMERRKQALFNNLIASAGIYTDQPHYFNAGVQLGYKYAYVSAAYSFHATAAQWRFGGGVTFPVTEKVNLGLSGSYGTFKSAVDYFGQTITVDSLDSIGVVIDTVTYSGWLDTKSDLLKIGLSIDYKIMPWLQAFVCPAFNTMQTAFSDADGSKSPRSVLPVPAGIRREDFDVLKTLLNFSNDFNENSSTFRKSWFSVQVGIRISFSGLLKEE